jgi:hypothetical protein
VTHRQVWTYVKERVKGEDEARTCALKIFCENNWILQPHSDLVNQEMFSYFEADLEERGQRMVSLPRNKQFPTRLSRGWTLLSVSYGTGMDDYLSVVLAFDQENCQFATWLVNYDVGPQLGDVVACANGHYFDLRDSENDQVGASAASFAALHDFSEARIKEHTLCAIRRSTFDRAFADFHQRSSELLARSVDWLPYRNIRIPAE